MRVASLYLRLQRGPTRSPEALRREYRTRAYPLPAKVSRGVRKIAEVKEARVASHLVYTLTPRATPSDWHIVYTHGGSFVHALDAAHWDILAAIVASTRATVSVPIYPLAPEHPRAKAFELLEAIYRDLVATTDPGRIALCGDSAGGNLALAQALHFRDRALPLPARIVLFSPWLDLTLADPAAIALEQKDVMLRRDELVEFGRWWAGATDPRDPLLSPLFADLAGLPPILIFQGTHDLFLPDARTFRDRAVAAGVQATLFEADGAFHDYMAATFTPEAKAVFAEIAKSLR